MNKSGVPMRRSHRATIKMRAARCVLQNLANDVCRELEAEPAIPDAWSGVARLRSAVAELERDVASPGDRGEGEAAAALLCEIIVLATRYLIDVTDPGAMAVGRELDSAEEENVSAEGDDE